MNEFQRKLLDTVRFTSWIAAFADPARTLIGVEAYSYVVDARGAAIDQLTAQSFNLVMDSDSEFACTYISGAAVISAPVIGAPANGNQVTEFSPSLEIQVRDQSSGRTWFDIPTPLPLIAGAGGFPFILASPRISKARSTITVEAKGSFHNGPPSATFEDFMFCLHGAKLYYAGPTP